MVNLFFDGYVLACPGVAEGEEAAERFILGLIDWQELQEATWANVFISIRTYDALVDEDYYPGVDRVGVLVRHYGLPVQVRDVLTLINSLLARVPTFEDHFRIGDVSTRRIQCATSMLHDGRSIRFRQELEWLLIRLAVARFVGRLPEKNSFVIGRLRDVEIEDMRVEADTDLCVFDPDDLRFNCIIDCTLRACATLAALYASVDPVHLWMSAQTPEQKRQAIQIALVHRGVPVAEIAADPPLHPWRFGHAFLASASTLRFGVDEGRARRLLRSCCDTILNEDLGATHALRTGRGGNNPQRVRGSDSAWRRDIDHEFHLHYWVTDSGPELASVVVHQDFSIPQ